MYGSLTSTTIRPLVSETYAYRYETEVGSYVTLATDAGEKNFKVVGIYYDYGTDIGIVSLSYKTYRKYWNDDKLSGVLVYAHDGTDIDALMKEIRSLTDTDDQLIIQSNKSLMTASIAVFDRTFLITRVLQSLAIIVAFIGVLSALMAIQLERIREFGILRANGLTPRQLWYNVLRGEKDAIFHSKTFSLCSVCYYCTLRCPRGLTLTEAMSTLKQISVKENPDLYKLSIRFYQNFLESVRRHGRVREMEFMTLFFLSMKNPFLPLKFTPLGMRLMWKGKVSPEIPSKGRGALEAIFRKVSELEEA